MFSDIVEASKASYLFVYRRGKNPEVETRCTLQTFIKVSLYHDNRSVARCMTFKFLGERIEEMALVSSNRKVWFKDERWPLCLPVDLRIARGVLGRSGSYELNFIYTGQVFRELGEFISRPYQTRWSLGAFEELSDSHRPTSAGMFRVSGVSLHRHRTSVRRAGRDTEQSFGR